MVNLPVELAKLFPIPVQTEGNGFVATWTVPAELPYFNGHFPGQPVLPAVAVLDATSCVLATVTGKPGELTEVISAKFTAVIAPGQGVRIRLEALAEGEWLAHWRCQSTDGRLAELRVRWRC